MNPDWSVIFETYQRAGKAVTSIDETIDWARENCRRSAQFRRRVEQIVLNSDAAAITLRRSDGQPIE
jgi:hypothetical protein